MLCVLVSGWFLALIWVLHSRSGHVSGAQLGSCFVSGTLITLNASSSLMNVDMLYSLKNSDLCSQIKSEVDTGYPW